ncbi:MAG: glycosyltransferase family 117 protein [Lutibacter sp.]
MTTEQFKKWNTRIGWVTFAIALFTYASTIEPTVSYWDCGEYIPTAVKLEVGHPPGAPLFQMMGAFFAMFTSKATEVAKMVNLMSALSSALTILFMFWTITALGKRLIKTKETISTSKTIALLGSGLVGALAYAYSDSFWFSAVEAEVYATSSFLMALLFWLGLRWEAEMDTPKGNKWLLIISFVVGLSFGVHILSLLVIPSIVFLYIFKRYGIKNVKSFILANLVAVLVLLFVFKLLFPFTLKYFSALELFFVNTIGLPFNSGSIIAAILLITIFYFGIKYTHNKNLVHANTLILSILFIMIGFSTWLMLPIRANADTTINENDPASARELLAYYNREQYGDANVFYDTYYSIIYNRETDSEHPTRDDKPKYEKNEKLGKYVIVNHYKDALPNWSSKHKGIIPRMVSTDPGVIKNYKAIAGIPQKSKRRPTFLENLKFMFDYQFGYMYMRYFMWNFVGRQNDIQGQLDNMNGNWLSGINFIDEWHLGPQTNLPSDLKNNKGRNTYFFLPFMLGIIGLVFQFNKNKNDFYTLLLFFLFTGLAIIFYTNPKPFEPRERDYAVVGSFYIFAIWIGFGVLALYEKLKRYAPKKIVAITTVLVCFVAVPSLMAAENWNDHDRSGRYTARLNAKAYLDSCDKNAILFTIGDNDTFPLWYLQEAENYRTDIKTINTSLFQTDWYIDQMKRKTYDANPIPSQLKHNDYKWGTLDVAYYFEEIFPQYKDSVMDINYFMKWIQSKNKVTFYDLDDDGIPDKVLPTNKIRIPVDKKAVLENGIVAKKDSALIVPYIDIKIGSSLTKNRILMLDILANNHWKQPIYFTGGAQADEEYIWMKDYLQLDGLAYKLVPIKTKNEGSFFDMGRIDTDILYNRVKNWNWRNITDDHIYLDPETRKNTVTYRNNMERLVRALIKENKLKKAEEILDISLQKMPVNKFGHYSMLIPYIELYYKLGKTEKARKLSSELKSVFQEYLTYFSQYSEENINTVYDLIERNLLMYDQLVKTTSQYDSEAYANKLKDEYISYLKLYDFLIKEN